MKKLSKPRSETEWRAAASILVKANLILAGMDYGDLAIALRTIGVAEDAKSISAKLLRGSFSAAFFLQVLSLIGVETIEVPGAGGED